MDACNPNDGEKKIPELLTIPQLAERLGLSYGVALRMVKRGGFATIQAGKRTYVNFDSCLDFLYAGEERNNSETEKGGD